MISNILLQATSSVDHSWWYYFIFMPIIIFKFLFFSFFMKFGIIKGAIIIITILALLFVLIEALSMIAMITLTLVIINNNKTRKVEEFVKTKGALPDNSKEKIPVNSALNLKE